MSQLLQKLLLALFLSSAVSGSTLAQDLRFTVWSGNQAHLDMLNGFAAVYKQDHPDVNVQFDVIPFGEYVQKLTIQLAGGNPPDLGWLAEASAPTFIDAGVLADVSDTLQDREGYNYADFSEPALGLWVREDAVYGIPFSTSPFITYFNRDMFEQAELTPPDELAAQGLWSWEAAKEAAEAIQETTPQGVYGFESVDGQGYGDRTWHTLIPIIRAYGGEAWEGDDCRLDSPEAVQATQLYHSMVFDDGSAVPPGEIGDFFSGNAGMTITQLSRVSKLEGAAFDWGIAPLPGGPAGDTAAIGQAAIVVFKNSPSAEVAADFLAFMTEGENVATMAEFFPPARLSVLESDTFLSANPLVSPEQMQIVAEGIAQGTVLPNHPNFPQIDATARPIFDKLWQPDADVQAVLSEVCSAIEPLLAQQ